MKRIFALFLVFLLIPCMVFPASAAETTTYVDLMNQGYFYVNGEPIEDFSFISSGTDIIEFPVDVIGGIGDVEFVVECSSAVTIKSNSGTTITKSALDIPGLTWYTKDLAGETSEVFKVTTTAGSRVTFISASAYYPDQLRVALPFDSVFRAGSFREELEGVTSLKYNLDIEDYMSSSVYTTYVSDRLAFDIQDIAGLDSIDLTLYTIGMSITSISAYSGSNVYIPVTYSFYESADPAVERNRVVVHMDISNVPYNEWVYLYFYGVTTSSSSTFWFEVSQVMGYISRPGVSGEVGLLQKIWNTMQKFFSGDPVIEDEFGEDMEDVNDDVEDYNDVLSTAPTIDIEDLEDQMGDIMDSETDPQYLAAFERIGRTSAFTGIILISICFATLGYILYGKR